MVEGYIMKSFGQFIKSAREEKGLTLTQVAEASGISHSHLSRIESGDRNPPKTPVMQRLAKALGVSFIELMDKAGQWEKLDNSEKELLVSIYNENEQILDEVLSMLRSIRNDAGDFPSYLHEDLFRIFGGKIILNTNEQSDFDKWYEESFMPLDPEEKSESDQAEAFERFNSLYNYKNIKEALLYHDERYYFTGGEDISTFHDELNKLFEDKQLKNPNPSYDVKEFVSKIDLTDEELLTQFTIAVDGKKLSEKQIQKIIAQVRLDREFDK
ncbi:helix-turn-helix domain-containing protein [Paenibacillus polymyxa]|uniref:helix-turn-helix domain-containing protein n=1 Tax=Paenibacillus polymyxa TaxID=1406 RepID=UPI0009BCAB9D|nr:helix-turn-helix transcriptional regulator [Paenibacillus polymyxa]